MPHEYDFFTWLRHLSEAQTRADEKALAAQKGDSLLRKVWGPDQEPLWTHEDRSQSDEMGGSGAEQDAGTYDLFSLLKFLGEE